MDYGSWHFVVGSYGSCNLNINFVARSRRSWIFKVCSVLRTWGSLILRILDPKFLFHHRILGILDLNLLLLQWDPGDPGSYIFLSWDPGDLGSWLSDFAAGSCRSWILTFYFIVWSCSQDKSGSWPFAAAHVWHQPPQNPSPAISAYRNCIMSDRSRCLGDHAVLEQIMDLWQHSQRILTRHSWSSICSDTDCMIAKGIESDWANYSAGHQNPPFVFLKRPALPWFATASRTSEQLRLNIDRWAQKDGTDCRRARCWSLKRAPWPRRCRRRKHVLGQGKIYASKFFLPNYADQLIFFSPIDKT